MANGLLLWWLRLMRRDDDEPGRSREGLPALRTERPSATIFLVLRRMRAPLITLIVIFAVSVLGLSLIPGVGEDGRPWRMGVFDAFYFMSYTATTIGFGELPQPFNGAQRLWVTASIYLTVIGWAYAIGSLLTLLQDRAFRQALALRRFARTVARLREPFLLIAGYGQTGRLLGRAFDELGRRFVVIDRSAGHIDSLELDAYHADVPGLTADARNPYHLGVAGLGHPSCEGVLALTDDDEANLAVTMAAALLRPDIPVIARTVSPVITQRMLAFGTPAVVNPFERFGDHLRLALRAPASYQLLSWLEQGPGAARPARGRPPTTGRWVVCGYGRLGRELTADLRAEGSVVTVIEPDPGADSDESIVVGDASDPAVMARADLGDAVGFVAATDNDTTNLSVIAAARRINADLFVAARQNQDDSAPLFAAMEVDSLLVPAEVVAHEVYAQLSTPLLWRFLREIPGRGDAWAAGVVDRLSRHCGRHLRTVWKVVLDPVEAPALRRVLGSFDLRLGDLLRSPDDRDEPLAAVVLLVQRGDDWALTPGDDFVLTAGDQLLLAGRPSARRSLDTTLAVEAAMAYVLFGQHVPASWFWRRLAVRGGAAGREGAGDDFRLPQSRR